ncbi:band 7 family-domain-containing protein [Neocallimastix lanati (nom. inval.)]|nr:band 7 family-domain-containing protein [Neocallimastix sp. JGI-2020a]
MDIEKEKKFNKKIIIGFIYFIITVAVILLVFSSFTVIDAGHTGVVVRLGKVSDNVLNEGFHFKLPIITNIVKIDNRVLKTEVESNSASKDLQSISSKVSVNYRVNTNSSAKIYKNVGNNFNNVIVNPAIQECMKSVTAKYNAEELITKRAIVSSEMEKEISQKINPYGLNIEVFNIIDFDFSEEFSKAIEAKQTAQQQALKAEQDLARIKVEASQTVEKAKAESEAYQLKNQQLTDKVIMMEFVEKWDGKLPVVTSGGSALFDMNSFINTNGLKDDKKENNNKLYYKVFMMEFVEKWDGKLPAVTSGGSALFDMSLFINSNGLKDDKKGKL